MPKERRKRIGAHAQSVRLDRRQFAAQENTVEHVEVGASTEVSGNEILESMAESDVPALKKKEKQQLKREAFLHRLESSQSPYSRSHTRRMKRKAKEQIATGLGEIHAAISAVDNEVVSDDIQQENTRHSNHEQPPKPKPKPGQIGEGKSIPLSRAQRKRALQMEQLRHPMILKNPDFASNPFQTIRTHAQNTLLKHEPPS